jgi:hypothetical protein
MEIKPFQAEYLEEAAGLFVHKFKRQRLDAPALPAQMEEPWLVKNMLAELMSTCPGAIAVEGGRLLGYLGWYQVENFRGTPRRGAHSSEWAHSAREGCEPEVYRALYSSAAAQWADAG